MKRLHIQLSCSASTDTPPPNALGKKSRQLGRHGLFDSPVEGLTVVDDTPEGQQRQHIVPETTQRLLADFCLNTPLSLSQDVAGTPPLITEGTSPQLQHAPQQPCSAGAAGGGRHRLATISNMHSSELPNAGRDGTAAGAHWCSSARPGISLPIRRRRQQHQHTQGQCSILAACTRQRPLISLVSPPATLAAPGRDLGAAPCSVHEPNNLDATAGNSCPVTNTAAACPGSAGGFGDDGFVLRTSQSYTRASQPLISPSLAAGLSAPLGVGDGGDVDEPFTTPSQDSREPPQQSPSNITCSHAMSSQWDQQQQQPLSMRQAHQLATLSHMTAIAAADGPSRFGSNTSTTTTFDKAAAAAVAETAGESSCTPPGELQSGMFPGQQDVEQTTPELELVGIGGSSGGVSCQEPGEVCSQNPNQHGNQPASEHRAGTSSSHQAAGRNDSKHKSGAIVAVKGGNSRRRSKANSGGAASGVVCEEVTTQQLMFPIFRPKSCRKCLILVRHGESTYNRQDSSSKNWADPQMFDAPLTAKGRQQAVAAREPLRKQLERHIHLGNVLWLSSPLSRALETMTLAAPDFEALAPAAATAAAALGAAAGVASAAQRNVMVLSLIAEHCATTGDVGLPASQLMTRFPALASELQQLPEQWWFNPCQLNPNCAIKRTFGKQESIDQMRRRVSEFGRWLRNRPEQLVVAFGHSTFWKYFANSRTRMRNCEVLQIWW